MKIYLSLFMTLLMLNTAGASDADFERNKQVLKDLCTLNLYLTGIGTHPDHGSYVADELLDPQNILYPESTQKRISYFDRVEYLTAVLAADTYNKEFSAIFGILASNSNVKHSSVDLCQIHRVVTPNWIQFNIGNPTYDELRSVLLQKYGTLDGVTVDKINTQVIAVASEFIQLATERNKGVMHNLSLKGSELIDDYLVNGIRFYPYNDGPEALISNLQKMNVDEVLNRLEKLKNYQLNPVYWVTEYLTGISFPQTINPFKLHAQVLPEFEVTYRKALKHIRKGDFQAWWSNFLNQ